MKQVTVKLPERPCSGGFIEDSEICIHKRNMFYNEARHFRLLQSQAVPAGVHNRTPYVYHAVCQVSMPISLPST